MKKLLLTLTFGFQLLAVSNASAQMYPVSMQGQQKSQVIIPIPAQAPAENNQPGQQQIASTEANVELKGYSAAFIAKQFNQKCNLGVSDAIIGLLAVELQKAEASQQITQETINSNIDMAQKMYNDNPTKFCADAQNVAGVIKGMFAGQ